MDINRNPLDYDAKALDSKVPLLKNEFVCKL
jgi:hypothetical protein